MENPEEINKSEQEPKGADYLRKQFEALPYLKKPFGEWSDENKEDFLERNKWNNFMSTTFPVALSGSLSQDKRSYKEVYKRTDEGIAQEVESNEHSWKYYNGSVGEFYDNVKTALQKSGANVEELRERAERNATIWEIFTEDPQKFMNDKEFEEMRKERIDNLVLFYLATLPALFNLIDSGYTEIELKR